MSPDVAQEYNRLAEKYAAWRPSRHFKLIFEQTVLQSLGSCRGRQLKVLDAGCGHGTWLTRVLDYADSNKIEINVVGIDMSDRRIAIARSQLDGRGNVTLMSERLERVTFSQPFDVVYSAEVFQHLTDREQASLLERWWNELRTGGAVIVIDKDRFSLHSIKAELQKRTGPIGRRLFGIFPKDYARLHSAIRYPSFRYLAKVSRELGFRPNPLVRVGHFTGLKLVKPLDGPLVAKPAGQPIRLP